MLFRTLFFLCIMSLSFSAKAENFCLIAADAVSGKIVLHQGQLCDTRISPASTFKVALAVMGYDAGVLLDEHHPSLPYHDEYKAALPHWKKTTDPTSWQKDSVVWYSQVLTRKLCMTHFQKYVDAFAYGNRDLSGNPGKEDGLTQAWLGSSLKISPREQIVFLRKLYHAELPVTKEAQDKTKAILPEFATDGWTVFGKTGTDYWARDDRKQLGWFVGWAEKTSHRIIFAYLIKDAAPQDEPAGPRARKAFLDQLPKLQLDVSKS